MSDETTATVDPAQMTGLELLRWMGTQVNDRPSIGRLLGMEMREVNEGSVSFALTPARRFQQPARHCARRHLRNAARLGHGLRGTHDASRGVGYTTLELKLNYIRTVPLDGDELTAHGSVIHVGGRTATAEGKVLDKNGKLVAHGTTTCMIFR